MKKYSMKSIVEQARIIVSSIIASGYDNKVKVAPKVSFTTITPTDANEEVCVTAEYGDFEGIAFAAITTIEKGRPFYEAQFRGIYASSIVSAATYQDTSYKKLQDTLLESIFPKLKFYDALQKFRHHIYDNTRSEGNIVGGFTDKDFALVIKDEHIRFDFEQCALFLQVSSMRSIMLAKLVPYINRLDSGIRIIPAGGIALLYTVLFPDMINMGAPIFIKTSGNPSRT